MRRRSSGGPSRQKMRPFRRVERGGTSTEQVRAKHCRPEPQGARQSPDKDRVKTAQLLDTNPIGRRGAALAGRDETTSRQEV